MFNPNDYEVVSIRDLKVGDHVLEHGGVWEITEYVRHDVWQGKPDEVYRHTWKLIKETPELTKSPNRGLILSIDGLGGTSSVRIARLKTKY